MITQQQLLNMHAQDEFLSEEEVNKLQPEDIADYEAVEINGKEYEFFGDLNAPILFKIEEEGKSTICIRGWDTAALVSFGNFMLLRHPEKVQDAIEKGLDVQEIMPVTDADISNWRFLLGQDSSAISTTMSKDDDSFPGDGTNMGEEI